MFAKILLILSASVAATKYNLLDSCSATNIHTNDCYSGTTAAELCDNKILQTSGDREQNHFCASQRAHNQWCGTLKNGEKTIVSFLIIAAQSVDIGMPIDKGYIAANKIGLFAVNSMQHLGGAPTFCKNNIDGPGWHECDTPVKGDMICLYQETDAIFFAGAELLAYDQYYIQHNYESIEGPGENDGSPLTSLLNTTFYLNKYQDNYQMYDYAASGGLYISITMRSQIKSGFLVLIPGIESDMGASYNMPSTNGVEKAYLNDFNVGAKNVDGTIKQCESVNGLVQYQEIFCDNFEAIEYRIVFAQNNQDAGIDRIVLSNM